MSHDSKTSNSDDKTPRRTWGQLVSAAGPFVALLVVVAIFWGADSLRTRGGAFTTLKNFQTVCVHASPVAVAALGMLLIIIAGGIDLSVGAAIALAATVLAWCLDAGYPPLVSVSIGVLTGCAAGFVNGLLISLLRVVPFIVTLGTMTLFQGVARIIAGDTPIRPHGEIPSWIPALQTPTPDPAWLLVSRGVWLMLALAIVVAVVLRYTVFGRHVFALGSNESTARLCGINVPWNRIAIYALAGLFVGVAGLFQFAILEEGDPTSGLGKELRIIAAVVIGGGSLSGGRGSVIGTLSGALIMAVIDNGCTILRVPDPYKNVIVGVIIIAAVTIDQLRHRRQE